MSVRNFVFSRQMPKPQDPQNSISLTCPACLHRGILQPIAGVKDSIIHFSDGATLFSGAAGARWCPNTACGALIFVVVVNDAVVASYPPETIDFDASSISPLVLSALEESIKCHAAGCFVASAIMVRKTLETVCDDRGATGDNLWARLEHMRSKVILPDELFQAMHDLRLLGNDAAHIESKTYNQIGTEEVEVGIELAKEVLKAIYQYSDLLNRLRALKAPAKPAQP